MHFNATSRVPPSDCAPRSSTLKGNNRFRIWGIRTPRSSTYPTGRTTRPSVAPHNSLPFSSPDLAGLNWNINAGKQHPAELSTSLRLPDPAEIGVWNRLNADQSIAHIDRLVINGPATPVWFSEKTTHSHDVAVAVKLARRHLPVVAELPPPVLYSAGDQLSGHVGAGAPPAGQFGHCWGCTHRHPAVYTPIDEGRNSSKPTRPARSRPWAASAHSGSFPLRPFCSQDLVRRDGWWRSSPPRFHGRTSRPRSGRPSSSTSLFPEQLPGRPVRCSRKVAMDGPTAVARRWWPLLRPGTVRSPEGEQWATSEPPGESATSPRPKTTSPPRGTDPPTAARQSRNDAAIPDFRLHQSAVSDRVFGLDEDLHRTVPVQHQTQQILKCEQSRVAEFGNRTPAAVPSTPIRVQSSANVRSLTSPLPFEVRSTRLSCTQTR